jgi:hypothetical protein
MSSVNGYDKIPITIGGSHVLTTVLLFIDVASSYILSFAYILSSVFIDDCVNK